MVDKGYTPLLTATAEDHESSSYEIEESGDGGSEADAESHPFEGLEELEVTSH